MYRIIGGDGREYGPVSALQIEHWIAQNRVNGRTRIRSEPGVEWCELSDFPEFASALAARAEPPPVPGSPVAAETAAPDADVRSPEATGAAAEPSSDAASNDPVAAARLAAGQPYPLSVFEILARGWEVVTRRFWITVGATTLLVLLTALLSAIPYAGAAVTFAFSLVFIAGGYRVMLQVGRGEPAGAGDVFAGFTRALRPLLLLTIVVTVATRLLALLALGPLLWKLHASGALGGGELARIAFGGDPFSELAVLVVQNNLMSAVAANVGPLLALPVLMLPLVYFSVAWIFAPILVIDRGVAPLEALALSRRAANRHWVRLFLLNLAFFPLMLAGLLCFGVGIFVVLALSLASFAAAYEAAFRPAHRRQTSASDERP